MFYYRGIERFQWYFYSPNECGAVIGAAGLCGVGGFSYFYRKLFNKRKNEGRSWLYYFFNGAGLLFSFLLFSVCEYYLLKTYSRGGYVAFLFGLAIFGALTRRFSALIPTVMFFILLTFLPYGWERLLGSGNIGGDASIGNRVVLWKGALAMSVDYWQEGVGWRYAGPFQKLFRGFYQPLGMNTYYNTAVNDYLTLSAKGGIFVLFEYLASVFCVLYWGYLYYRRVRREFLAGFLSAVSVFLGAGMFSTLLDEAVVFYPLICVLGVIVLHLIWGIGFYIVKELKSGERDFFFVFKRNIGRIVLHAMIPVFFAVLCCGLVLAGGIYYKRLMSTNYEIEDWDCCRIVKVYPRGEDIRKVVVYLPDSQRESFEEVAHCKLRPFALKGAVVFSIEHEGGFAGKKQCRKLLKYAMKVAEERKWPLFLYGNGEGGRFALILATEFPGKIEGVTAEDSELDWPFEELSPMFYADKLRVPVVLKYNDTDLSGTGKYYIRKFNAIINKQQ